MKLIRLLEKYPIPSIVCFVILTTAPWLNEVIVSLMEARNFITAREMLSKGNWILTTLNEVPRYEKPPLPTWLTAISAYFFGIENTWALRLPAIGMLILLGIYVYRLSLEFTNKEHAIRNALISLTSFYILSIIVEAPWDIYTHTFMLMAIVHFIRYYASSHLKDAVLATVFIACSVLSKGPVALYVLLLPFLIAYSLAFGMKKKVLFQTLFLLLTGISLGSIWFIYVRFADPEPFIEIAARETSNWSNYQTKPFYYYWSFFIQSGPWMLLSIMGLLYPFMIKRVSNKKAYKLSFYWTLFALLLLSLIPEKKTRFLMPVLIPLAVNTGFYIQYLSQTFSSSKPKRSTWPGYINFGLLGILSILFPTFAFLFFREEIQVILHNYIIASIGLILFGSMMLHYLYKKNINLVFYSSILIFAIIMAFLVPILARIQNQNEVYAPISELRENAKKQNIEVYLLDLISPEMLWDYGASIQRIEKKDGTYSFPQHKKFGLLVNNKDNLFQSTAIKHFDIEEVATFNRNVLEQSARRHRQRNINYFYILTEKNQE